MPKQQDQQETLKRRFADRLTKTMPLRLRTKTFRRRLIHPFFEVGTRHWPRKLLLLSHMPAAHGCCACLLHHTLLTPVVDVAEPVKMDNSPALACRQQNKPTQRCQVKLCRFC